MASKTQVCVNAKTEQKPIYFDTKNLPWETIMDEHQEKQFQDMKLILNEDSGLLVNLSINPKGYYKAKHVHECSHGILVLKGTFKTDEGEFGPGTFIWYPEGTVMSHGATDREECIFLYIQDQKGELIYLDEN